MRGFTGKQKDFDAVSKKIGPETYTAEARAVDRLDNTAFDKIQFIIDNFDAILSASGVIGYSASVLFYKFIATEGQTVFSGSDDNGRSLRSLGNATVFVNYSEIVPYDYSFNVEGTELTFNEALHEDDVVLISAFSFSEGGGIIFDFQATDIQNLLDAALAASNTSVQASAGAQTALSSIDAIYALVNDARILAENAAATAITSSTEASTYSQSSAGHAEAALTSQTIVASLATAAEQSAAVATLERQSAETARAGAEAATVTATLAQQSAESASAQSMTASINSANSATEAGDHAAAAAIHTSVAESYATASAQNASATSADVLAADTALSGAVAAQLSAAQSETNAAGSSASASNSSIAAANSATLSGDSASAAAVSASSAASSATESSQWAEATQTDRIAAETALASALVAESNATTSETNAAGSASSAESSSIIATDAASLSGDHAAAAGIHETNAAQSEVNAAGSASSASISATAAANSATQAGNSASAASTYASTAATEATDAAQSASAAQTAQIAAETAEANALASEVSAVTSETNAAGHAASAQSSSILAADIAASVSQGIFSEHWLTSGSVGRWQKYSGSGEVSIVEVPDAPTNGKALRIGNNSGNDEWWALHEQIIPFDPGRRYKTTVVLRRTQANGGAVYLGFAGVLADGTTLCNVAGTATYTSQHYHAAVTLYLGSTWETVVGYTEGHGTPNGTNGGLVHENVRFLRPLILANHNDAPGIVEIASFIVEDVTESTLAAASASAAVQSASNAAASEGLAGQHASAANLSRIDAETAQGAAEAAEASAVASETNAAGSAASASMAQSVAVSAANAAAHNSTGVLNPGFEAANAVGVAGPPPGWFADSALSSALTDMQTYSDVPTNSPHGSALSFGIGTVTGGAWWKIGQRFQTASGQKWDVSFSLKTPLGNGPIPTASNFVGEDDVLVEFRWLDAEGSLLSTTMSDPAVWLHYQSHGQVIDANYGWGVVTCGQVTAPANSAYVEISFVAVDYNNSLVSGSLSDYDSWSAGNCVVLLDDIEITSPNGSVLSVSSTGADAASSASASADSASTASIAASDAGNSADAAEVSRLGAVGAQGAAEAARDLAVSYRDDAEGSAVSALASSVLTANIAASLSHGVFSEHWSTATAIDRWVNRSGSGETSIVEVADAPTNGNALRIGNNSGNDQVWAVHEHMIPFDPTRRYKTTVVLRRTQGTGTVYLGFTGVRADGVTLCNMVGAASFGSQHYHAGAGLNPSSSWQTVTGYTEGFGSPNGSYEGLVHEDVRYLRPLILANYNSQSGIVEIASFVVEDVTETTELSGRISSIEALDISELTGTAMATFLSEMEVNANGNSAKVTEWSQTTADLDGIQAAAIGLRAVAGSAGAELELVAMDDPESGPASAARINADNILLEGTTRARHLIIDEALDIDETAGAFRMGKESSVDFVNDGIYLGRTDEGGGALGFGFHAGRVSGGVEEYIQHTKANGLKIKNATFMIGAGVATETVITTSQTVSLVGEPSVSFALAGGGGGGGGGNGQYVTPTNGSAGQNTVVVLKDGTTTIQTWTANGGAGGVADGYFASGVPPANPSSASPYGDGGQGGQGQGVWGAVFYKSGLSGAAGAVVQVNTLDLTAYSDPKLVITIGAAGTGGAGYGAGGANGGAGRVLYTTSSAADIPAAPVGLTPSAAGAFWVASGVSGVFPVLTPARGLWVLNDCPTGFRITPGAGNATIHANNGTVSFIAPGTPTYNTLHTSSSSVRYHFYPM